MLALKYKLILYDLCDHVTPLKFNISYIEHILNLQIDFYIQPSHKMII